MRHKDAELKRGIYEYINDWMRESGRSPTLQIIADRFGVSRCTIHRYLKEMTEENYGLVYNGRSIETREFNRENMNMSTAKIVGTIPCGEACEEEEYIEGYVNLPASIFGRGVLYILRASGDSMEDAGIYDGDLVVIKQRQTAEPGDIVFALDDDNRNTLKRFAGFNNEHMAVLEYMNEAVYPGETITVKELNVQGVAERVIRRFKDNTDSCDSLPLER